MLPAPWAVAGDRGMKGLPSVVTDLAHARSLSARSLRPLLLGVHRELSRLCPRYLCFVFLCPRGPGADGRARCFGTAFA